MLMMMIEVNIDGGCESGWCLRGGPVVLVLKLMLAEVGQGEPS
jgi:hypothetical protein